MASARASNFARTLSVSALAMLLGWSASSCDRATPADEAASPGTPVTDGTAPAADSPITSTVSASPQPTPTLPLSGTAAPASVLPSGTGIAYIDYEGLWYIDADGPRLLVAGLQSGPMLVSPNGRWVAYPGGSEGDITTRGDVIAISPTSGGATRELLATNELPLGEVALDLPESQLRRLSRVDWSPDSQRLYLTTYFGSAPGTSAENAPVLVDDLWSVDPETGDIIQVLTPGMGGNFEVSPDASLIAVTKSGWANDDEAAMLAVANADGSSRREIFSFPRAGESTLARMYARPHWGADSDSILVAAFATDTTTQAMGSSDVQVHRVYLDGRSETLGSVSGAALRYGGPTYLLPLSPDGLHLATVLDSKTPTPSAATEAGQPPTVAPSVESSQQLFVDDLSALADGSEAAAYDAATRIQLGDWSPDSERFVYSATRASDRQSSGDAELFIGREGQPPVRVVDARRIMRVQWLDAEHLVLLLGEDTPWLVMVSADGDMQLLQRLAAPADRSPFLFDLAVANPSAATD